MKVKVLFCSMKRPRAGDFLYSEDEIELMIEDIRILKANGADGFVFGVLTKSSHIDTDACKLLLSEAKPLPVTFHRAIDQMSTSVESAVELIIELGFSRILASGQQKNAKEGIPVIKKLVSQANGLSVGEIVWSDGSSCLICRKALEISLGDPRESECNYGNVGDIIQNAQKVPI